MTQELIKNSDRKIQSLINFLNAEIHETKQMREEIEQKKDLSQVSFIKKDAQVFAREVSDGILVGADGGSDNDPRITIMIGEVVRAQPDAGLPLVYYGSGYCALRDGA